MSLFVLAAAAAKARLNIAASKMRTRSPQAELLLALSPDTSIAEAFKRFGVSRDSTALLVVLFESTDPADADDADVLARLRHHIDGEHVEHIDLAALRDMPAIAKIYGIDPSLPPAEAEALILGAMALQGNQ